MNRRHQFALLFIPVWTTIIGAACIIPSPVPYISRGNEMRQEQWVAGVSTRDDVLGYLPPSLVWEDENTFLYFWQESASAVEILLGYSSSGPVRRWEKYIGRIRFDEMGVVRDLRVSKRPTSHQELETLVYGKPIADMLSSGIQDPPRTKLLMRVELVLDGRRVEKPLDYFRYLSAGFGTMGVFEKMIKLPVRQSYEDSGWLLFEGEPGEWLYLAFRKARAGSKHDIGEEDLQGRPALSALTSIRIPLISYPWRVEVPDASLAYIGTFIFQNRERGSRDVTCEETLDESHLAGKVVRELFPDMEDLSVSFAGKHEAPLVIRTPFAYK